jgi:hypothetical protein
VGDRYAYDPDRLVTQEEVEDVLRRVGIGEDELVEMLGPVTSPAPCRDLVLAFDSFGLDGSSLFDRMDSSPSDMRSGF